MSLTESIPANNFLGSNLPKVFWREHWLSNIRTRKKSQVTSAFFGLLSALILFGTWRTTKDCCIWLAETNPEKVLRFLFLWNASKNLSRVGIEIKGPPPVWQIVPSYYYHISHTSSLCITYEIAKWIEMMLSSRMVRVQPSLRTIVGCVHVYR